MPAPDILQGVARALETPDISPSASTSTSTLVSRAAETAATTSTSTGSLLLQQWSNPSDVLSVLLIIGGDIVQKALAETSGGLFTPVCFSFGWVAYSFTALVGVLGSGRLLPEPDYPVKVFNLANGYMRENRHWVIGRLVRDNETFMTKERPLDGGAMRISIFEAARCTSSAAVAGSGRVRVLSIITMLLQFGIAAIPAGLWDEWGVLMITGGGTLLALAEKMPSKTNSNKNFALTSGNGSRDIMIIRGCGNSLDLEELAASESPRSTRIWEKLQYLSRPVLDDQGNPTRHGNNMPIREARMLWGIPLGFLVTGALCTIQSILWIVLLITVAGLKSHSWFILAVGALGMFQNAAVAAISRDSSKRNLPLIPVDQIISRTVMDGLMDLEVSFPTLGQPLVDEFFPKKLRDDEQSWWDGNRGSDTPYDEKRNREQDRRGIPRSMLPTYHASDFKSDDDATVGEGGHETVPTPGSIDIPERALTPSSPLKTTSPISLESDHHDANQQRELPAPSPEPTSKPPSPKKTKSPVQFQDSTMTHDFASQPTFQKPTRAMTSPERKSVLRDEHRHIAKTSLSVDEIYNIVQSPEWT
ncbi:hypothetical protein BDZ45DRAFT_795123 [Acephala macrosclerotiorum]|nr:hypothetical protein BDZ45DRAFT_795123 [Acephala macrosclerotiorum]